MENSQNQEQKSSVSPRGSIGASPSPGIDQSSKRSAVDKTSPRQEQALQKTSPRSLANETPFVVAPNAIVEETKQDGEENE